MARLLTNFDYLKQIQQDNLLQIIEDNYQVLYDAEMAAQAEITSYLAARYLVPNIFTDTSVFSNSATYKAKNLVYLDALAFNPMTVYLTGQLVLQAGNVYSSIGGSAAHAFDPSEWNDLGVQYTYFYTSLPYPEYNPDTTYQIDDVVWYADNTYTCASACQGVLPSSSTAYWGSPVAYSVTNTLPTDTTKFTQGDNRNQQIVMYMIDITLYHLHSRINPRNVPDLRMVRYDGNGPNQTGGAIGWLKHVASGDVTADLPNISPQQGVSISWGVSQGLNSDGSISCSRNTLW